MILALTCRCCSCLSPSASTGTCTGTRGKWKPTQGAPCLWCPAVRWWGWRSRGSGGRSQSAGLWPAAPPDWVVKKKKGGNKQEIQGMCQLKQQQHGELLGDLASFSGSRKLTPTAAGRPGCLWQTGALSDSLLWPSGGKPACWRTGTCWILLLKMQLWTWEITFNIVTNIFFGSIGWLSKMTLRVMRERAWSACTHWNSLSDWGLSILSGLLRSTSLLPARENKQSASFKWNLTKTLFKTQNGDRLLVVVVWKQHKPRHKIQSCQSDEWHRCWRLRVFR